MEESDSEKVFCGNCAVKIKLQSRYCWKCKSDQTEVGHPKWSSKSKSANNSSCSTSHNVPSRSSFCRPPSEGSSPKPGKIMSLDDFIREKTSKRSTSTEFQARKKKKANSANPDVTINIGQKKFIDDDVKTIWGKRLSILVPRNATYAEILHKGVEKWKAFDRNFNGDDSYVLLYQDGSYARFLPGSFKDFFELEKYKTELGKDFKKITLYLCTSRDFELSEEKQSTRNHDDKEDEAFKEDDNHESSKQHGCTDVSPHELLMRQIKSDEEFAQRVQEEWDDNESNEFKPKTTEDIFRILAAKVDSEKLFSIATRRKAPLTRQLFLWQRQTKKNLPTSQLQVHYAGEDGVDSGAIRKEFLENTLQEMREVIFPNGSPIHSTFHVQNSNFRTCGEIVATSIAQGGPASCFLKPCAFEALWKAINLVNISDEDLTKEEHAVLDAVRSDCSAHIDLIVENGYSGQITNDHIEEIVKSLKVSFVNRRVLYMNEFKIGLNVYGLGDLISSYPDICKPLFLQEFHEETIPDGDYLFSFLKPKYSPESTSKRVIEESIMDHMQDVLISFEDHEVVGRSAAMAWKESDSKEGESSSTTSGTTEEIVEEVDLSVAGVMGWLTGQKHKHVFGEKPTINVHFDHECLQRNPSHNVCYPVVGACGRDLTLPVAHMKSKEEFKNIFLTAFCMGQSFAKP